MPGHFENKIESNVQYRQDPNYKSREQAAVNRAQRQGLALKARLEHQNKATERSNELIVDVLRQLTQADLDTNPRTWWNWWQKRVDERPELRALTLQSGLAEMLLHLPPSGLATGTIVWTSTGRRPIEQVVVGDLVLSQHPTSGELEYKAVLETRHAIARTHRVDFATDEFACAPGTAFWQVDGGWWLTRDLDDDAAAHRLGGVTRVSNNSELLDGPTHHLLVADFNSYFIGSEALLVHDSSRPRPTSTRIPGLPLDSRR